MIFVLTYISEFNAVIAFAFRFANDIELMTGSRPGIYWMMCWKYLSPLTMMIIVIASFAKIIVEGSGYLAWVAETGTTRHLEWPPWAQVLIAILVLVSALWIPGIAVARYDYFMCCSQKRISNLPRGFFPISIFVECLAVNR